ncbi:MAG: molybdopterin-guanine dinucleotide biosynthesis protein B [Bacillus sp. (in: Bacteria)]|nr:molybdopterin-guanine dinucleotide biosynthesis protein B [Bacillus sp. (in: firmicutes)]
MKRKLNSPAVFQVVGYSNSGKTTLVKKWLEYLSLKGWKAATIKHHGHGRKLTSIDEGKDSSIHRNAGALGSLVTSDQELQWSIQLDNPITLEKLVNFYGIMDLDLIIVEGFKREAFPKLLLIRGEEDFPLVNTCSSIRLIICWRKEDKETLMKEQDVPVFHIDQEKDYLLWLDNWLQGEKGE